MLPFTLDQFISVLIAYNHAIWPIQIVAYVVGLAMLGLLFRPGLTSSRLIAGGLALMWAWTGIAYHWLQFTTINRAAYGFAALFIVQAAVLVLLRRHARPPSVRHSRTAQRPFSARCSRSMRWCSIR